MSGSRCDELIQRRKKEGRQFNSRQQGTNGKLSPGPMSDEGDGDRLEAEEGGHEADGDREEPTSNTDGSNEASETPADTDSGVAGVGVAIGADFVPSADTSVRPEETASTSAAAEIANEIIRELKLKVSRSRITC